MILFLLCKSASLISPGLRDSLLLQVQFSSFNFDGQTQLAHFVNGPSSASLICLICLQSFSFRTEISAEISLRCDATSSSVLFRTAFSETAFINYFRLTSVHPAFFSGIVSVGSPITHATSLTRSYSVNSIGAPKLCFFLNAFLYLGDKSLARQNAGMSSFSQSSAGFTLELPVSANYQSFQISYLQIYQSQLVTGFEIATIYSFNYANASSITASFDFHSAIGSLYFIDISANSNPSLRVFDLNGLLNVSAFSADVYELAGNILTFHQLGCDSNLYFNTVSSACQQFCPLLTFSKRYFCIPCLPLCTVCSRSDQCSACINWAVFASAACSCIIGTYLAGIMCATCPTGCQVCSNSLYCSACFSNYVISSGICGLDPSGVAACGQGFFLNSASQCELCFQGCSVCSSAIHCNSCQSPYHLSLGSCRSLCSSGTYRLSSLVCDPCFSNCLSCSSRSICLSCSPHFTLTSKSASATCLFQCAVDQYQFLAGLCSACQPSCDSCVNLNQCISCTLQMRLVGGDCKVSCGVGEYTGGSFAHCLQCPSACSKCLSFSECLSCKLGYEMKQKRCVLICAPGFFLRSQLSCSPCISKCQICSEASTCLACSSGYSLDDIGCRIICPITFFTYQRLSCQFCTNGCYACLDQNYCYSCLSNHMLQGTQCSITCYTGTFKFSQYRCRSCLASCLACTSQLVCTACNPQFHLNSNLCQRDCPLDQYLASTNTCLSCPIACSSCISEFSCTSCGPNYLFFRNSCLNCSVINQSFECNPKSYLMIESSFYFIQKLSLVQQQKQTSICFKSVGMAQLVLLQRRFNVTTTVVKQIADAKSRLDGNCIVFQFYQWPGQSPLKLSFPRVLNPSLSRCILAQSFTVSPHQRLSFIQPQFSCKQQLSVLNCTLDLQSNQFLGFDKSSIRLYINRSQVAFRTSSTKRQIFILANVAIDCKDCNISLEVSQQTFQFVNFVRLFSLIYSDTMTIMELHSSQLTQISTALTIGGVSSTALNYLVSLLNLLGLLEPIQSIFVLLNYLKLTKPYQSRFCYLFREFISKLYSIENVFIPSDLQTKFSDVLEGTLSQNVINLLMIFISIVATFICKTTFDWTLKRLFQLGKKQRLITALFSVVESYFANSLVVSSCINLIFGFNFLLAVEASILWLFALTYFYTQKIKVRGISVFMLLEAIESFLLGLLSAFRINFIGFFTGSVLIFGFKFTKSYYFRRRVKSIVNGLYILIALLLLSICLINKANQFLLGWFTIALISSVLAISIYVQLKILLKSLLKVLIVTGCLTLKIMPRKKLRYLQPKSREIKLILPRYKRIPATKQLLKIA